MKQIFAWLFAAIFFAAGCAQSPDLAEPVRGGGYENADGLVIVAACPPATRTDIEEGKSTWEAGDRITVYEAASESDEANYISSRIISMSKGKNFKDFAVLYRTNAQSNAVENAFKRSGIPYRIIGGTRFFDRAEVKDMLAYLCVINNRADELRLQRIINNPPRGIGGKTLEMAQRQACRSTRLSPTRTAIRALKSPPRSSWPSRS